MQITVLKILYLFAQRYVMQHQTIDKYHNGDFLCLGN